VTARKPELIAVDGIAGAAIVTAARAALTSLDRNRRSGISHWDASGVFEELAVADDSAGQPSVRTLLLLYAADLAFRLRWELRPAMAEGRSVVAAPYVDTAIAFGRAAGLDGPWLTNLFLFAPRPTARRFVGGIAARAGRRSGFVEFGFAQVSNEALGASRTELVARMTTHLRAAAKRYRVPADKV
jgi:thymidylate kinase